MSMLYTALAGVLAVLSLFVFVLCFFLLKNSGWFRGFIRGVGGMLLIVVSVVLLLAALNLNSFESLKKGIPIATISFQKLGSQHYLATLARDSGDQQSYKLNGDLWQLDARVLRWTDLLRGLGLDSGYRLDRLSGRFVALEQARTAERSVYDLGGPKPFLDLWDVVRRNGDLVPLFEAEYGSATYVPMADGAIYSVSLEGSGLVATPLNNKATSAVSAW